MSNRDGLILVAVLAGLCALGYFALPGQNGLAGLIGAITGFVAGARIFGVKIEAGTPLRVTIGIIIGLGLFGLLLAHMTNSELAYMDLGDVALRVRAATYAVCGLFFGIALRIFWISTKARP